MKPLDQLDGMNDQSTIVQTRLMDDTSIWYKGLLGMILCILPGAILGLLLVRMSLMQAKDTLKAYKDKPYNYTESSLRLVKQGQKMAYIGLAFFIVEIVALVGIMSAS